MARPSIDDLRDLGDFQTLFRWNVNFTSPAVLSLDTQAINFQCYSTEIPKATISKYPINIRGYVIQEIGYLTYPNKITLTFVETVDSFIKDLIYNWREAIMSTNKQVASGPRSDLVAEMILQQLNSEDETVWTYTLRDVFLEDYELGTLDGSTPDNQKPSISLSYAYFYETPVS